MWAKIFLTVTGGLYLYLAIFCTFFPEKAAQIVHLEMKGAGGRSEFMTVYGGLEFGIAVLFLLPVWDPQFLKSSLLACLLIHGSLVLFRMSSFLLFAGAFPATQTLAIGELVIFVLSLILWFKHS